MNINTVGLVFFLLIVAVGCASTPETDSRQAAEQVQATEVAEVADVAEAGDEEVLDPNEVICKKIRKTGTRQKTKVCATRAQWDESAANASRLTEEMQARPQYGNPQN
jgi:hypothetical protein